MRDPQDETRKVIKSVWMDTDGQIHQGRPAPTPEEEAVMQAALDRLDARYHEAREHPERFLFLDDGHEAHRRGQAACQQGCCEGGERGIPACPLCRTGLVHRSLGPNEPARCDACDKQPPPDSIWVGDDGTVSVGTPPGMSPEKAAAIREGIARVMAALDDDDQS